MMNNRATEPKKPPITCRQEGKMKAFLANKASKGRNTLGKSIPTAATRNETNSSLASKKPTCTLMMRIFY